MSDLTPTKNYYEDPIITNGYQRKNTKILPYDEIE